MKIIFLLLTIISILSADLILDRIIAIIDDKPILESEVNEYLYMAAKQQGQPVPQGEALITLKSSIIKNIINDKILLIAAEAESLAVNKSDIIAQRNSQIDAYIAQTGSVEALEQELIRSNTASSLPAFKQKLLDNLTETALKQMLMSKYEYSIQLTKKEITDFFEIYKDSLPPEQNSINLGHIMVDVKAGEDLIKTKLKKAHLIIDSLRSGANFDTLARYMSEDSMTAKFSGDLGFFKKGDLDLDPKFEDVAFRLEVGSISTPIKTKNSLLLVKCIDKKEEEVRVKIIVLFLKASNEDLEQIKSKIVLETDKIKNIKDFKKVAEVLSTDKVSGSKGGDLGWLPQKGLTKEYLSVIENLEIKKVSEPVLITTGSKKAYHIFMIFDKKDSRPYSLKYDYKRIEQMAKSYKLQTKMAELYKKYEKKIYIENRQAHNIYK